jgi:nicotinamidase-related amidase
MPTRATFLRPAGFAAVAAFATLAVGSARAETIIDEWAAVKTPPPPALKPVTVDPKTTALLLLDFNRQTCNPERRPRCIASIPRVKPLLAAARSAGMPVAFSLGGGGKLEDIAADLTPLAGEPVVSSGVDKFLNTNLETILKDRGVTTVIVCGAAAHGAIIYTVAAATLRGFKAIVPVDCISADSTFPEQYTAWHFANAPVISPNITLTTLADLKL